MRTFALLIALSLLCGACTTHHGTYTVLSNKIVNVENFDASNVVARNIEGEDTLYYIFGQPAGKMNPNLADALTDAFEKAGGGDAMSDVTVLTRTGGFWPFYTYYKYVVKGDVIKTRQDKK